MADGSSVGRDVPGVLGHYSSVDPAGSVKGGVGDDEGSVGDG